MFVSDGGSVQGTFVFNNACSIGSLPRGAWIVPPCLGRELYRASSGVVRVRARARGLIYVCDSCSSTAAGRRGGVLRHVEMTTARKSLTTLTPRALVGRMQTTPELRCFLHARLSLFECSVLDRFRFAVDQCLCSLSSAPAVWAQIGLPACRADTPRASDWP